MHQSHFVINGVPKTLIVDPQMTLMDVVRKQLLLTGTKDGCEDGHCGSCAVLVNGKYTLACITKMSRVPDGAEILTVEGIGAPGNLHPVQQAFILHGAAQCGFCTPGFVVSAVALLNEKQHRLRKKRLQAEAVQASTALGEVEDRKDAPVTPVEAEGGHVG